ncbi:class I SAM-dependent methyltransferase [Paraburkholderia sp. D15]|uniref:class I SAM-dependent methyltransferase n=1 Tax=Paraburkholderia sp. D15 TaxID=2880218 RepID=UPI00247A963A|nr:class I SAM-dependent methyltransferase [Paraburkholderia sp. D15]WGS50779.1 class I SAM-dependent methyltransferase [Paraburkholderia sp. D15]WKF58706.1 putative methyltransferase YcgJ [Paraburkholderia busanensis]
MKHHDQVADAFGSTAAAYLTSQTHATGADLRTLATSIAATPGAVVLDMGCGAGHASFAVAPHAHEVVAYDIAPQMLTTVEGAARERGLANIRTQQGAAEKLPFAGHTFDWVISRMSAHHWHDVPLALAEVRRVLKPGGRVLFIDIAGSDHPLLDTHLQAVEVLRDGSHIRDYRADEWLRFFEAAGFKASIRERWRIDIEFSSWVARMRTPEPRVVAIRSLWTHAPDEVRAYFDVQDDGSFKLDALMVDAQ